MLYIPICWNHTEEFRKIFKNTLSYYLSNNELDYFEFFENTYPSFTLPDNTRDFYVWIWEEFYGKEPYYISEKEISKYKVVDEKELLTYFPGKIVK